jgi:hypothetical protein
LSYKKVSINRMRKFGFLTIVFFLSLFPLFSSHVLADPPTVGANLSAYLQPTGGDCTINVPSQYATIQAAVNAANSGNVICVGPGTYNEDITIDKSVRLSGSGSQQSTIVGQNGTAVFANYLATNVIVEGFSIHAVGVSNGVVLDGEAPVDIIRYNWIKAENGGDALASGGSQNLIQNNILEGNNSPFVADTRDNTSVFNNTFIGTMSSITGGDYLSAGAGSVVKQNIFNPTSGPNPILVGSNNSIITENNFHGNNTPVKVAGTPAINAQGNWWGDTDPSDNVRGDVDYSNFATVAFPEYSYNAAPVIRPLRSASVVANSAYDSTSYFLDTGSSAWTATVDYGDGSGVSTLSLSGTNFSLSHVYQNTGTYTVTVSVTDDQNATGTDATTITVSNAAITVGANLSGYTQPTGGQCNVNVPSQYPTIQAGIDAANTGDTVCVGPGTYNENINIYKPMRLSGSGVLGSIINAQSNLQDTIHIIVSDVTVEGFIMHGGTGVIQTGEGFSGITLRSNWMIAGNGGRVLWLGPGLRNSLIQNNLLEGNNSSHIIDGGRTYKVDFLNNTFTGSVGSGVVIDMKDPGSLIRQNAFHITGTPSALMGSDVNSMINENNLEGVPLIKVIGTSEPIIINAENNWWGDTDPSDNITQAVDFTPFATNQFPEYPTPVSQITYVSPAKIWVGLKNSDDVGIKFDLKAEVYKDSTLVTSGQLNTVGGGAGFNNAHLDTILFNSFSPVDFPTGSVLKMEVYVRNACTGSGHNSGTARLWYNDSAANSQFGATIVPNSNTYFLLNSFLLGTSAGAGPKKTVDIAAGAKCSAFKPFGTWTITP